MIRMLLAAFERKDYRDVGAVGQGQRLLNPTVFGGVVGERHAYDGDAHQLPRLVNVDVERSGAIRVNGPISGSLSRRRSRHQHCVLPYHS